MECQHPDDALEMDENGAAVCTACGTNLDHPANTPALVGDEAPSSLGLKHVTWSPDRTYAARPYTPEEVELEIMGTIDLLERGTQWLVGADQARYDAKMKLDIERARKLLEAPGRSQELRDAWVMLQTEELYRDWQRLEIIHKTRERAMHNVRAKLSGLQSVAKNLTASLNVGGSFR